MRRPRRHRVLRPNKDPPRPATTPADRSRHKFAASDAVHRRAGATPRQTPPIRPLSNASVQSRNERRQPPPPPRPLSRLTLETPSARARGVMGPSRHARGGCRWTRCVQSRHAASSSSRYSSSSPRCPLCRSISSSARVPASAPAPAGTLPRVQQPCLDAPHLLQHRHCARARSHLQHSRLDAEPAPATSLALPPLHPPRPALALRRAVSNRTLTTSTTVTLATVRRRCRLPRHRCRRWWR